jgi:hypothetical protein
MAYEQVIEGRYIDRKKLLQLLQKVFPERNYAVRVSWRAGFASGSNTLISAASIELLDIDCA